MPEEMVIDIWPLVSNIVYEFSIYNITFVFCVLCSVTSVSSLRRCRTSMARLAQQQSIRRRSESRFNLPESFHTQATNYYTSDPKRQHGAPCGCEIHARRPRL